MKKLMIAAATAAMVGGVFADAQVWEMTLNTKTTGTKLGKVKAECADCEGATSYRKQASLKLAGLFWGCTCDEMVNLTAPVSENEGVFFWNATKKAAFYDQDAGQYAEIDFNWDLKPQRIGQKANECEGVWTLNVANFTLTGAGFGKVAGCDDASYIKSMNGSFAGTFIPGNGCKRCEEETANAWLLCDCSEPDARTAAYGSWTLKYNASATKKFADSSDWSWYKFPGDTLEAIKQLIDGSGGKDPTDLEKAKANLAKAQKAYDDAKKLTTDLQEELAVIQSRGVPVGQWDVYGKPLNEYAVLSDAANAAAQDYQDLLNEIAGIDLAYAPTAEFADSKLAKMSAAALPNELTGIDTAATQYNWFGGDANDIWTAFKIKDYVDAYDAYFFQRNAVAVLEVAKDTTSAQLKAAKEELETKENVMKNAKEAVAAAMKDKIGSGTIAKINGFLADLYAARDADWKAWTEQGIFEQKVQDAFDTTYDGWTEKQLRDKENEISDQLIEAQKAWNEIIPGMETGTTVDSLKSAKTACVVLSGNEACE